MALLARAAASNPEFRDHFSGTYGIAVIEEFIRRVFRYRPEREEVLRTPEFMLDQWIREGVFEGDCDDVSTMLAAIFKVSDIPVRFVAIRFDGAEFKHVFVEAFDGNQWIVIDPTVEPGTPYRELERMVVDI